MMAADQRQPEVIRRLASLNDVVNSGSANELQSPLAQFKDLASNASTSMSSSSGSSLGAPSSTTAQTVPALDLNLFRTASVYSMDSLASIETASSSGYDHAPYDNEAFEPVDPVESVLAQQPESKPDTPTTPRAERTGYFDTVPGPLSRVESDQAADPAAGPSSSSGAETPTRTFFVRSRPPQPPVAAPPAIPLPTPPGPGIPARPFYNLAQPPNRPRLESAPEPVIPREVPALHPERHSVSSADLVSIHGEEGNEWGDDEAQFEWLDTDGAPEAENGNAEWQEGGNARIHLSPSKRLAKLKSVVPILGSGHGEGRKLKKQVVFPRRAAPPPPPGPGTPRDHVPARPLSPVGVGQHPQPQPLRGEPFVPTVKPRRPPLLDLDSQGSAHSPPAQSSDLFTPRPPGRAELPVMVALKDESGASTSLAAPGGRGSHMSLQSVAYSIYDLDGDPEAATSRAMTPSGTERLFPKGKYTKVSASQLAREVDGSYANDDRESTDEWTTASDGVLSPDEFVNRGFEARGQGDLPKSVWYFMQAAEGGSATGRMYWGLALRHGLGVAKDDKRAFAELRRACEESMAGGGIDLHQSPAAKAVHLSSQQKKAMTKDLSVGLFEIANCFLEGVGVKKAPDVAMSYLRFAANMGDLASQEQLGFLLSKGSSGIKKDMKEAAKWYRMAIGQGSTNTFGLAWVWKDKYME